MNDISLSKKVHLPSILIAIGGLIVSLYALIVHLQILMSPGHGAFCDINVKFNCTDVISSSYGEIASIPLGAYGMTYFIILLAAAFLPKYTDVSKKQLSKIEFLLGLVGFISVVILFYISHSILNHICPTCSVIHVLTTLYFILKIISLIKNKGENDNSKDSSDFFIRFLAVCLSLGIPPLAVGLIAPIIVEKYLPSSSKTVQNAPEKSPIQSQQNIENPNIKLLTIHKTNYVGNGEDYRFGNDNAKVVVQMFSDFGCPHCKEANEPLKQALNDIGLDKVLFVDRFFPLTNKCNPAVPSEGWYPYSCILAEASRCAGAQGKFFEFKDWGFSGQEWPEEERAKSFSPAGLKQKAKELGLNTQTFSSCLDNHEELNKIKEDASIGDKLGLKGTPMILINGEEYKGPHTRTTFEQAISAYL